MIETNDLNQWSIIDKRLLGIELKGLGTYIV